MPKSTTSPYIIVKRSSIHHKGIFAKKDIPIHTRVMEYVGERISKAEAIRRADEPIELAKKSKKHGAVYLFELNKKVDIDGNVSWNTARYINHSCEPNCETDIIRGKIYIIATKFIRKGEEITYNYGYDFDDYKDHPCECGTTQCHGYILSEELWPRLRRHFRLGKAFDRKGVLRKPSFKAKSLYAQN